MKLTVMAAVATVCLSLAAGCGSKASTPPPVAHNTQCPNTPPMPLVAAKKTWTVAPAMKIHTSHSYQACIKTLAGNIVINLMPKAAPQTVNAFIILANHGFYTGGSFTRVVKNDLIQGGQTKTPGFKLPIENPGNNFIPTTVALAHSPDGHHSNVGQLFICQGAKCANLDGSGAGGKPGFTVFGFVSAGMKTVNTIVSRYPHWLAQPHGVLSSNPGFIRSIRIFAAYIPPSFPANNSGS